MVVVVVDCWSKPYGFYKGSIWIVWIDSQLIVQGQVQWKKKMHNYKKVHKYENVEKCNSKYSTGSQTTQKYAKEHQSKIKCKKSKSYKNSKKSLRWERGKFTKSDVRRPKEMSKVV